MMDKNILLAHFWVNSNHLVTTDGIELDLMLTLLRSGQAIYKIFDS
ncbi:hypothetical protein ABIE26_000842 [Pedobacter africanus]|uniref:Uncharacterized protein n=1 Tax=Pedobacter africanus TaxID=151894 RepID=A0ACC6KU53_9SPHI|nr:hypothetical protein [Pedobacter africanus]MDR6782670.1 hypothetical protein [Pedobacter africanus]